MSKGLENHIISGPLAKPLLMYALPIAATGILQQLFNAADVAVVGQFVGPEAMAAVGANSPLVGLIVNLFVGLSLGSTVVIANAVGRKDLKTISRAVPTSIIASVLAGIVVLIVGELLAEPIMESLSVPAEVMSMAVLYLRVYLVGVPVIVLYNFESAIFRGDGNTRTPLIALTISGVINVFLNLFFVIVVGMTVDGVALATVISNAVSSMVLLRDLLKTDSDVHLSLNRQEFRIDRNVLRRMCRIGVPAGLQGAVFALANIVIQAAINSLGTIVMAASSAAYNVEVFAYDVLNSFSQACTTFVGQNNGAGKIDRCRKTLRVCFLEDAIASALSIVLILLFGHQILRFFNTNPEVIETGYVRLIIIFIAYIFSMQYELMSGYMRGFGISVMPSILTMIGIVGVRLFIIFAIFPHSRTFPTIMSTYPVSMAVTAVMMYIAAAVTKPAKRREEQQAAIRAAQS